MQQRRRAAAVGARPAGPFSYSSSATRSPSIEMSMSSKRAFVAGGERHLEHVLAVGREHVVDDHAAARAVRRALDVIPRMLRHVARVACRCDRSAARCWSPTAMRLMSAAALRYASSSVGDSACSSAMLSKFALFVSSGSQLPASTSSAEQVAGWRARTRGGSGAGRCGRRDSASRAAAASTRGFERRDERRVASRHPDAARRGGGIMPACSLRIIFSATSAFCAGLRDVERRERQAAGLAAVAVAAGAVALHDRVEILACARRPA